MQLGGIESSDASERKQALALADKLEDRFRRETSIMVEELLAGWRQQYANATQDFLNSEEQFEGSAGSV